MQISRVVGVTAMALSLLSCAAVSESAPPAPVVKVTLPSDSVLKPTSPVFHLTGYQAANGLVSTFKGGDSADPYFGLYALKLGREGGLDTRAVSVKFIEWGLGAQQKDGRFQRYCKSADKWAACGRTDSDDATLARWMELLHAAGGAQMPVQWQSSFERADKALMKLRMSNGVFSVFTPGTPGYDGYALFKDNVEVLSAFEQVARQAQAYGQVDTAAKFDKRSRALRLAMKTHFGAEPYQSKMALGASYDKERFYPHAVATPFAWLEGYYAAPNPKAWSQWLTKHRKDWVANAKTDFPWGLIAVAALKGGQPKVATDWLRAYTPYRTKNEHWNVLEEASAQVIEGWSARQPKPVSKAPAAGLARPIVKATSKLAQ